MEQNNERKEGWACCGGSETEEMAKSCPCRSFIGRYRRTFYAAAVAFGLAMLALPIGWLLGVIAFFRTL